MSSSALPAASATLHQLVQYGDRDRGRDDRNVDRDRDERTFARGKRLPRELRTNAYVYYDWRQSSLPRAPQGFRWMLIGEQYVLASIANGQIRDVRWTEEYQERMARRDERADRREDRAERREDRRCEGQRQRQRSFERQRQKGLSCRVVREPSKLRA